MNENQGWLQKLSTRLSQWWSSTAQTARERGGDSATLRREAGARAKQAADKVQDFRESDRGQRAASKLSDLRTSDTARKAEAKIKDLRASEAGQKAETALTDLRQREPVKKAEESARKVVQDLFSGSGRPGAGPGTGTGGDR